MLKTMTRSRKGQQYHAQVSAYRRQGHFAEIDYTRHLLEAARAAYAIISDKSADADGYYAEHYGLSIGATAERDAADDAGPSADSLIAATPAHAAISMPLSPARNNGNSADCHNCMSPPGVDNLSHGHRRDIATRCHEICATAPPPRSGGARRFIRHSKRGGFSAITYCAIQTLS